MGLRTTADSDCRFNQGPKSGKAPRRDIETLAGIISPIVSNQAEAEAEKILAKFGTFRELFQKIGNQTAIPEALNREAIEYLKIIAMSFNFALEEELVSGPVLAASGSLRKYLFHSLSSSKKEMFRVLFLDTNSRLIEDRLMGIGTVNRIQIYVREIIRDALELDATALILVHNHPCGDPSPSKFDIALTNKIINLCQSFDLDVLDHLIVAKSGVASLRSMGLLDEGEISVSPKLPTFYRSVIESWIESVFKTFGRA
ncbi:JAB domain-containing protein [Parasphingorhabdus halotolerans]|uniref:DNA repair protein RadC n=1 Tax=Parasphingorhabdus halotolerans TaxID=2725558 RepID=A0A6H2DK51_9SPHN|nr:DNA repair protein RadC [Parasphingorhabdus halotolerans]QJB68036.1 DNA repair protein RadC [Parasphingorhabdus halotolerans]